MVPTPCSPSSSKLASSTLQRLDCTRKDESINRTLVTKYNMPGIKRIVALATVAVFTLFFFMSGTVEAKGPKITNKVGD